MNPIKLKCQKEKFTRSYEFIMSLFAFLAVILLIIDFAIPLQEQTAKKIEIFDTIILVIFTFDYFFRLVLAKNKKKFFKENIWDLIAILPLYSFLKLTSLAEFSKFSKLVRVLESLRILAVLWRFIKRFKKILTTNNFHHILLFSIFIILSGALGISITENMTFGNALWWSFVTVTTVGYGDVSPHTIEGRILASILMIFGIGFLGGLTSTITTYFLEQKDRKNSYKDEVLSHIVAKLQKFDELSQEEVREICNVLSSLKK